MHLIPFFLFFIYFNKISTIEVTFLTEKLSTLLFNSVVTLIYPTNGKVKETQNYYHASNKSTFSLELW